MEYSRDNSWQEVWATKFHVVKDLRFKDMDLKSEDKDKDL